MFPRGHFCDCETDGIISSMSRQIASDDEYVLQTVTVFKKIRDDFIHKCRENKQVLPFFFINSVSNGTHRLMLGDRFIVRDFTWDDSALEKQKRQLADLEIEEKELWVSIPSFPSSFLSPLKKGNRRSAPSLTCLNRRRDCYA